MRRHPLAAFVGTVLVVAFGWSLFVSFSRTGQTSFGTTRTVHCAPLRNGGGALSSTDDPACSRGRNQRALVALASAALIGLTLAGVRRGWQLRVRTGRARLHVVGALLFIALGGALYWASWMSFHDGENSCAPVLHATHGQEFGCASGAAFRGGVSALSLAGMVALVTVPLAVGSMRRRSGQHDEVVAMHDLVG